MAGKTKRAEKTPAKRRQPTKGYPCGQDTHQRILEGAISAFGEFGFKATTTRLIAARAGVNLAALRYYFGAKEDLYRACAEHIAADVYARSPGRIEAAPSSPGTTRDEHIAYLIDFLNSFIEQPNKLARPEWVDFTDRATRESSAASEILYERVFSKTVNSVRRLFCQITNRPENDVDAQIASFALLGSVSFFATSGVFVRRSLAWRSFTPARLEVLKRNLHVQVMLMIDQYTVPAKLDAHAA